VKIKKYYSSSEVLTSSKEILRYTVYLLGSRWLWVSASFLGTYFMGKLGHFQLAAGALINVTLLMILLTAAAMLYSINVTVSKTHARDEFEETGKIFQQAFLLAAILGILVLLFIWVIPPILLLVKEEPKVVMHVKQFFYGYAPGLVFLLWYSAFLQLYTSIEKFKAVIYLNIFYVLLVAFLGEALAFGKWGFPNLGMKGIGLAFSIAFIIVFLIAIGYLIFHKDFHKYHFFKIPDHFTYYYLRKLFMIGWPIGLQLGGEFVAYSFAVIVLGWFGANTLAAQQIVMQLNSFLLMAPLAISVAASIVIARSLGLEKYKEPFLHGNTSIFIGFLFWIVILIIYFVFPDQICSLFLRGDSQVNKEITVIARHFFYVFAIVFFFDSIRNILTGALRGFHDTKMPAVIGTVAAWVSIPIGMFLAYFLHMGPIGIQLGFIVGLGLGALLIQKRFWKKAFPLIEKDQA